MQQITADIVASSAARCGLPASVTLTPHVVAEEGQCVAVRVLEEKACYNEVEDESGAFQRLRAGQVLISVLGERRALKGYSGGIPETIAVGDELHVLNLGGIIGRCTSAHPDLGPALRVEVLGGVLAEGTDTPACLRDVALEGVSSLTDSAPLVVVSGSSMDTGKTQAACAIIEGLTKRGLRVAAAKLTGAALQRDVRHMSEHGAVATATFTDAGVVASTSRDIRPPAKGVIAHLNECTPDVLVLELGDGFIGPYGVDDLLNDRELHRLTRAHVVAASDLAGAWAADHFFRERFCAPITAITGPVTDNEVGRQYIEEALDRSACNALQQPNALAELVAGALEDTPPAPLFARPVEQNGTASSEMTPKVQ